MMKKGFYAAYISIAVFAVITATPSGLKAENTQPPCLYARAMLVRIPADEFQPLQYETGKELSFPSPMDIAISIFGSSNTEQIRIAEIQMPPFTENSTAGKTESSEQMSFPMKKLTYNKVSNTEYYIIDSYEVIENCSFQAEILKSKEASSVKNDKGSPYDCRFTFSCRMSEGIPYEKLQEQAAPGDSTIVKSDRFAVLTFEAATDMKIKPAHTEIASCQKIDNDYWVLLLNISEYEQAQ